MKKITTILITLILTLTFSISAVYAGTEYTVQWQDSLWTIAQEFDISIDQIKDYNNLEDNNLFYGQTLIIPSKNEQHPVVPDYHIVQPGESMWDIAQQYELDLPELIELNSLKINHTLYPGQFLLIQNRSKPQQETKKLNRYYRIQTEETLEEIAAYFEIEEDKIRRLNQLQADEEVKAHQKLLMPVNQGLSKPHVIYTVNSEKYLFDLAYEYGVSIRSILKANYLSDPNTKFQSGDKILITVDNDSTATWINYEDGQPVNSFIYNY